MVDDRAGIGQPQCGSTLRVGIGRSTIGRSTNDAERRATFIYPLGWQDEEGNGCSSVDTTSWGMWRCLSEFDTSIDVREVQLRCDRV